MALTDNSVTTTNATTTDFAFTFPYLKTSDIKVSLDGTRTTDFTLANATTVRLDSAAGNGVKVRVFRETDDSALQSTFYAGSAIKSSDLNDNFTQNLYSTQEVVGRYISNIAPSFQGDVDMNDNKIIELATPTAGTDAAHKTYVDSAIDTALTSDISATGITITDNSPGTGQIALSITDGAVTTAKIGAAQVTADKVAANAVTESKIANNSVTSAKIVDGTIATADLADGSVTTAKLADGEITTAKIGASQVTADKVAANAVTESKIANNSVTAAKIAATTITASEIASDAITGAKIADNAIDSEHYTDGSIDQIHLAANSVGTTQLKDDSVTASVIADNGVTTAHIADAELTTLAGMQSGTASILASNTALTATTTDLNNLTGKTVNSSLVAANTNDIPTSTAVNAHVVNLLNALGGFVAIANDQSFPTSNPDPEDNAGTVVSVADAGGLVIDANGSTTTGKTTGNSTVTITGFPTVFRSTTLEAGLGVQVITTATLNTYTYHKIIPTDTDTAQLSDDINDFNSRYRIHAGEPSSDNDAGDLVYDTNADKMKVRNAANNAWTEVTSSGDFRYLFLCPAGGSGAPTLNGSIATYDLRESSNSGSAASVSSAAQLIVSIDGVIQKANTGTSAPTEGFALVDSNTIIFGSNLASGASIFIVQIGSAVSIPTPGDNTVSTAKIQNLAVTTDKIANDAVTAAKLADNAVVTANIASGNVTQDKLAAQAVITSVINDDAVTTAKIANDAVTGAKIADDAVGAEHIEVLDAALQFGDTVKAQFGAGNDLEISHDGSTDSLIKSAAGQTLGIHAATTWFRNAANSETTAKFIENGAAELYFDNSKKFETASHGINILDDLVFDNGTNAGKDINWNESSDTMRWQDNVFAAFGAGDDLKFYHNGTNSFIENTTGDLVIKGAAQQFKGSNDENMIIADQNNAVKLFFDNVEKLKTLADGGQLSGQWGVGTANVAKNAHSMFNIHRSTSDSCYLYFTNSTTGETGDDGFTIGIDGDENAFIWNRENTSMRFATNGTERLTITAGAETQVSGILSVHGDTSHSIQTYTDAAAGTTKFAYRAHATTSDTITMNVWNNGNLENTNNSYGQISDANLKENIVDAKSQWDDIKAIKIRNYNFKASTGYETNTQIGVVAQELETVSAGLVYESGEGDDKKKAVKSSVLYMKALKALQEAMTKIEPLETKVAALEAK